MNDHNIIDIRKVATKYSRSDLKGRKSIKQTLKRILKKVEQLSSNSQPGDNTGIYKLLLIVSGADIMVSHVSLTMPMYSASEFQQSN